MIKPAYGWYPLLSPLRNGTNPNSGCRRANLTQQKQCSSMSKRWPTIAMGPTRLPSELGGYKTWLHFYLDWMRCVAFSKEKDNEFHQMYHQMQRIFFLINCFLLLLLRLLISRHFPEWKPSLNIISWLLTLPYR